MSQRKSQEWSCGGLRAPIVRGNNHGLHDSATRTGTLAMRSLVPQLQGFTMKLSMCFGLVLVLASTSFASRGRNHREDVVSCRFNDLSQQVNFFVSEPSTFATYFPAEYCFFYQYGILSGVLTQLDFDRTVYED